MHAGIEGNIDLEILHGGVEQFLHDGGKTVDLIDEKDIGAAELGEDAQEIGALGQGGAVGHVHLGGEFVGDDMGEGGLAQAGRSVQEHVFHGLVAAAGGFGSDAQAIDHRFLANVLIEALRTQREVDQGLFLALRFA